MSKAPSSPNIVSIDCPRCGSRGYILRQSPSTENKGAVRIYLCGECGERTEINVLD